MTGKNANLGKFFFCIFVFAYAAFLLIDPQFHMVDDHMFLITVQHGTRLLNVDIPIGRFEPLDGVEYYILSKFISLTPTFYWAFNACQFILFALISYKTLREITRNETVIYITLFFFLLSPAFVVPWARFFVGERGAIFCSAVFLYCYFLYLKEQKSKKSLMIGLIGVVFVNLAFYYKEPIFLAVGSFTFFHLIFSWKDSNWKIKILDSLVLISSLVFGLIYFFKVYRKTESGYDKVSQVFFQNFNPFVVFSQSDPVLLLCLLPFTAWRVYQILIKKHRIYAVYDALLIAATVYTAILLKLHIHSYYYLVPAYIFAIPALLFFLTQPQQKLIYWRKWGFVSVIGFLLITTFPQGVSALIVNKYDTINYNQTLDFLAKNVSTRDSQQRTSIFLDGINRGTGAEFYTSVQRFLEYKGLKAQDFNLKSDLPIDDEVQFSFSVGHASLKKHSAFQSKNATPVSKGDYLLVTPYSSKVTTAGYVDLLKKDYKLLFQTHSQFSISTPSWMKGVKEHIVKRHLPWWTVDYYSHWIFGDYYVFERQ